MAAAKTVLAIVPARGGSKGIPRKNIRLVHGKPLIAYTFEQALASSNITRLILSTDDEEIANVGKQYGVDVPFLRPADLANDHASQLDAVLHTMNYIRQNDDTVYDVVSLLQPTAPLRLAADIDSSLNLLHETNADSVVGFCSVGNSHPYYMYTLNDTEPHPLLSVPANISRRQDFPDVYLRNGAIYAVRWDVLMEQRSFYGSKVCAYVMPRERSINVDTELDMLMVEAIIGQAIKMKLDND